jgi:hypothetical protein
MQVNSGSGGHGFKSGGRRIPDYSLRLSGRPALQCTALELQPIAGRSFSGKGESGMAKKEGRLGR